MSKPTANLDINVKRAREAVIAAEHRAAKGDKRAEAELGDLRARLTEAQAAASSDEVPAPEAEPFYHPSSPHHRDRR
jgi:hypothetical protein